MQKVLPLKRWEKHKLPERKHFSDQDSDSEDEEDECLDDEEFELPRKQRKIKRKPKPEIKPKPKPAKKRKIRIPKKDAGVLRPASNTGVKRGRTDPPGPPPGPPPKRIRGNEIKPSQIASRK